MNPDEIKELYELERVSWTTAFAAGNSGHLTEAEFAVKLEEATVARTAFREKLDKVAYVAVMGRGVLDDK